MNNFGSPTQPGRGNVGMAVLAGLVVAIACALGWGVVAYLTKFQFSIMAILVGLGVGTAMARIGRVRTAAFGVASAVLSVFGCALGSLVAEILNANRHGVPLSFILAHLNLIFRAYPSVVGGLGFLFWVFAALYGYRIGMGGSMRWGWSRRMRPPRGANQPYGMMNQPYQPGQQPFGGQQPPYGTPAQPYGAAPPTYGAPQPFDGQQNGAAQPPYGTPYGAPGDATQQGPEFGFKQPPPGPGAP
jgi:hypothetical protein